jgi:hypothetical protein
MKRLTSNTNFDESAERRRIRSLKQYSFAINGKFARELLS